VKARRKKKPRCRDKKNAAELLLRLSKQIRKDGTFRLPIKRLWSA